MQSSNKVGPTQAFLKYAFLLKCLPEYSFNRKVFKTVAERYYSYAAGVVL
jgi:hypothetical protein